jgi:hypothetical protein
VFLSVVGEIAIRPRSSRPVANVPPQESVPPVPQPEQCQFQVSWPSLPAQEAFHGPDMAIHCRDEAAQTPVEEKGPPLDKDSQWFKQFLEVHVWLASGPRMSPLEMAFTLSHQRIPGSLLSTFAQGLRRFVSELKGVCLVGEAFFAGSCVAAKGP